MKTISQLQQEIRSMQAELHKIEERLGRLDSELLDYREAAVSDSVYKRIYDIAETMPVIRHPIVEYGYETQSNYLAVLIMTAGCEDSINDRQLLFLQRMIMGDTRRKALDLYMAGIGNILPENVIFRLTDSVKDKLAYPLILDMLLISSLAGTRTEKTYGVIADIAGIVGVAGDSLRHISMIAAVLLRQNCGDYTCVADSEQVFRDNELYGFYLRELPAWEGIVARAVEKHKELEKTDGHDPSVWEAEYGDTWFYYV